MSVIPEVRFNLCQLKTDHTEPTGFVYSKALAALSEIGIQHEDRSKLVDEFRGQDFDLDITVCDSAAEGCPMWVGKGECECHSFLDPAKAEGTDAEIMNVFRALRDDLEKEIKPLLRA